MRFGFLLLISLAGHIARRITGVRALLLRFSDSVCKYGLLESEYGGIDSFVSFC